MWIPEGFYDLTKIRFYKETLERRALYLRMFLLIFVQQGLDPVIGIQQIADGDVVVQGVHQKGDILAHIAAYIVGTA